MSTARESLRRRSALGIALGTAAALTLSACASTAPPATTPAADPSPSPSTTHAASVPSVPGHDVGQFPPVPLFLLPDLSLLDASASAFTIETSKDFTDIPGVTVAPAHCDAGGQVVSGSGSAYLYGDGSGNYTGPDGTIQNFGDGSGNSTVDGTSIQNFGDGSGNYDDGTVQIQNFGDGSGNYQDATTQIQIFGDGSGNYTGPDGTIQNFGDGSGTYARGSTSIQNFGDGSGNYDDGTVRIQNFGDGTASVNGETVKAEPIAPVPKLGSFPPLAAIAPVASCGTTITFQDGVLFDFDKSDIRSDAVPTVTSVAAVLARLGVADAVVSGHTDAIGTDDENQALSEDRANAFVAALREHGATASLDAVGYGEARPVAPNEVNGADNPAGRQLNRRVEIFIPAL